MKKEEKKKEETKEISQESGHYQFSWEQTLEREKAVIEGDSGKPQTDEAQENALRERESR